MRRLLIMAGGTGGHIFPGLVMADTMRELGWQVVWLGTSHGMEEDLVTRYGIEIYKINFPNLRGKGLLQALRGTWCMLLSLPECLRIFRKRPVDVVLGMGGYVTVPGGFAARFLGIPLVIVNADIKWLLSNRILSSLAQRVLFGFPTNSRRVIKKVLVTGNPVSKAIINVSLPEDRYSYRTGPLNLLVLGGSLGAKALNECVPEALALIPSNSRPSVTHQSGKNHIESLRSAYIVSGVKAEVVPFIDDMSRRYADADLVICRAGAITISELTAAGVASILVPLILSTTSHQSENACWMESQKASIHLPQKDLNKKNLAALINRISRQDCQTMAQAAYKNGCRSAHQNIAEILSKVVRKT